MSSLAEIQTIAERVIGAALPRGAVENIRVEESVDEEGLPALRVTAIVKRIALGADDRSQDAQLDAKADLQRQLSVAGEDRFAYVRLVTPDELNLES